MSTGRATQAELVKRREEIQQLILTGESSNNIKETMAIKWKTSQRAIAEDIRNIGKDWQAKAPETAQLLRNKYRDRLEMILNKSLEEGQLKTSLDTQKEINKLDGLYKDEGTKVNDVPQFVNIGKRTGLKAVPDSE